MLQYYYRAMWGNNVYKTVYVNLITNFARPFANFNG